jgi:hypothetical protein
MRPWHCSHNCTLAEVLNCFLQVQQLQLRHKQRTATSMRLVCLMMYELHDTHSPYWAKEPVVVVVLVVVVVVVVRNPTTTEVLESASHVCRQLQVGLLDTEPACNLARRLCSAFGVARAGCQR